MCYVRMYVYTYVMMCYVCMYVCTYVLMCYVLCTYVCHNVLCIYVCHDDMVLERVVSVQALSDHFWHFVQPTKSLDQTFD